MSGPWEKYAAAKPVPEAAPTPQKSAGPWDKFAAAPDTFIDTEEHPKFSFADRFLTKNFAANPDSALAYLKEKHPEMDLKLRNGEIFGRVKGEGPYKSLDPKGFDIQDLTDLGYDIPAGVAQGAAMAALAPTGIGEVPGMAAVSAGTEGLRQMLGKALGIKDNVDPTGVAISGVTGPVALPFAKAFGSAASEVKPYIQKGVAGAGELLDKHIFRPFSHFTKEEALQWVNNKPAVKNFVDLLSTRAGHAEAKQQAYDALEKMQKMAFDSNMKDNAAMKDLLAGRGVSADLNAIEAAIGDDPRAAKIIAELRSSDRTKNAPLANRPFSPEISTTQAGQQGFEDLRYPAQMVPPSAKELEEAGQRSLLDAGNVNKPVYTDIPQTTPAAMVSPNVVESAPAQMEMFPKSESDQLKLLLSGEGANVSKMPGKVIPGKESAISALPQEEQLRLHLENNGPVVQTKGEITPARSEVFPSKRTSFSEVVQEPLNLPMSEETQYPASDIHKLKQLLGGNTSFNTKIGKIAPHEEARNRRLYSALDKEINGKIEGTGQLDTRIENGIDIQKELEKGKKSPISYLSTTSPDRIGTLAEAAANVGDTSSMDMADQILAARKVLGEFDRNKNEWVRRGFYKKAARLGLDATNAAVPLVNGLIDTGVNSTMAVAKKPIIWDELRKQIAKENYNE